MFYSNIFFSLFCSAIIIYLNFYFFQKISKYLSINTNICKIIFFNHLVFAAVFFLNDFFSIFNLTPGSDSLSFYLNSDQKILFEKISFKSGHEFLYYFTYFLKKINFDFISMNFFFGLVGSISILIFYGSISKYLLSNFDRYVVLIFILLPSYNFWTSGISKDVLTAFSLSLMLLSFSENKIKLFILSLILISFTRLHLSLLILMALATSTFLILIFTLITKKEIYLFKLRIVKKYQVFLIMSLLIINFIIIKNFFYWNFLNLGETIKHFQSMYLGKNFIESTFFPLRIFEYLSRPYLWEENNLIIKFLSLENIILLFLLTYLILNFIKHFNLKIRPKIYDIKVFILLSFVLILIFQITLTSNVGIAMRQKWVFLPGFIFIFIFSKFYFISNKVNNTKIQ
jgi:hypothetical protein